MRSPTQLLRTAWQMFTMNSKTFTLVSLITTLVITVLMVTLGLEPRELEDNETMSAAKGIFTLLSVIVTLTTNIVIIKLLAVPDIGSLQSVYKASLEKFLPYLWVTIMLVIVVTLGLILLIIPGIYLAVAFSFASFMIILEDQHGTSALKQSMELVKGRWFAVFGRYMFLILIGIVVGIGTSILFAGFGKLLNSYVLSGVSGFVSMLVTCFFTAYTYCMYLDIKGLKNSVHEAVQSAPVVKALEANV